MTENTKHPNTTENQPSPEMVEFSNQNNGYWRQTNRGEPWAFIQASPGSQIEPKAGVEESEWTDLDENGEEKPPEGAQPPKANRQSARRMTVKLQTSESDWVDYESPAPIGPNPVAKPVKGTIAIGPTGRVMDEDERQEWVTWSESKVKSPIVRPPAKSEDSDWESWSS